MCQFGAEIPKIASKDHVADWPHCTSKILLKTKDDFGIWRYGVSWTEDKFPIFASFFQKVAENENESES